MGTSEWSKSEKEVARQAFTVAYDRECKSIEEELRKRVTDLQNPEGLWAIHDYLTEKRRGIDKKYDYRYSVLPFVFARLLHEGWIKREDLTGLSEDKIETITSISTLSAEE
jgi:hypothetical protein